MTNTVAIIGRPNVGKSTLFNRLIGKRKAIVDEVPGVTRDRHYGKTQWNGIEFSVIDTGGYVSGSKDIFEKEIRRQVEIALSEADVILFLVDVTIGITAQDERMASLLRKYLGSKTPLSTSPPNPLSYGRGGRGTGGVGGEARGAGPPNRTDSVFQRRGEVKKIILVANKSDTHERELQSGEFYKLGMGEVHSISSVNGRGTGELLDKIATVFSSSPLGRNEEGCPKYAIAGRPNVGKSTLLNSLLGEERAIVTPVAGTTRDSIHTHYKKYHHEFLLIDTAGLRKKRRFDEDVEFYSNLRAIRAVEECDVCLLLIDAQLGMEAQDVNIFRLAERNKKGIVILVNKWDLIQKKTDTAKVYERDIKEKIAPLNDVPVLFISAIEKQRLMKVAETAGKVFQNRKRKIPDVLLNEMLLSVIQKNQPSSYKGKLVNIYRIAQIPASIPVFDFFCNFPKAIKESYKRFLENKLREKFDFCGVPIQIHFRKK